MLITAKKMMFSIKDFFNKCDQTRSFLRIWSQLVRKYLMENFIFCTFLVTISEEILNGELHFS